MSAVRDMRPAEVPAVSALLVAAYQEHVGSFPPPVARSYLTEVADVAGRLTTCDVLVAEQAAGLVGTVTLVRDAAHDGHPWPPGGAVLRLLAVAPEARRQGVGHALTTACLDRARARGARYVGLHTAPFMTSARRLYESLGFTRAPEHDFDPDLYYGGRRGSEEPPWGLAYVLPLDVPAAGG